MKRSNIFILLFMLVLVWLAVVAYLGILGSNESSRAGSKIDIGIRPVIEPALKENYNLDDVNRIIIGVQLDALNETSEKDIYYILGKDVDENGNASTWIYGIHHPLGKSMMLYDRSGWRIMSWGGILPDAPIQLGTLTPLHNIFIRNNEMINNNSTPSGNFKRQVELMANTYIITTSDDKKNRVFTFNATSGALIQYHEE
jgi:hypothetical protein